MQLIELTSYLITQCEEAKNRFFHMREFDLQPDFFLEVKPHADLIHEQLLLWQRLAKEWRISYQPKYMHNQQIDQVVDAMEQFTVQSFYKETSKKRFLQSVHSVHYTLSTLLRYLQEGEANVQQKEDDF
ncbi:YppE family protein [Metasolibacillus meyeri]|uniref:YppE family protein n=1 Tax=Metasolibacillus meyeri TaxID=1071052 RepID=A0AAW9NRA9_9BACL|nr:YppE family protein [Metasolibacillus meyeri]MEC1178274.1 YppE family protein [Metasolibacillus meyeri]